MVPGSRCFRCPCPCGIQMVLPRRILRGSTIVGTPRLGLYQHWKPWVVVLLALKLKHGDHPRRLRSKMTLTPPPPPPLTITGNRGNGAALNKLTTSRFSASAIPVEMSTSMKKMGIKAFVDWAPREGNGQSVPPHTSESSNVEVGCPA